MGYVYKHPSGVDIPVILDDEIPYGWIACVNDEGTMKIVNLETGEVRESRWDEEE